MVSQVKFFKEGGGGGETNVIFTITFLVNVFFLLLLPKKLDETEVDEIKRSSAFTCITSDNMNIIKHSNKYNNLWRNELSIILSLCKINN